MNFSARNKLFSNAFPAVGTGNMIYESDVRALTETKNKTNTRSLLRARPTRWRSSTFARAFFLLGRGLSCSSAARIVVAASSVPGLPDVVTAKTSRVPVRMRLEIRKICGRNGDRPSVFHTYSCALRAVANNYYSDSVRFGSRGVYRSLVHMLNDENGFRGFPTCGTLPDERCARIFKNKTLARWVPILLAVIYLTWLGRVWITETLRFFARAAYAHILDRYQKKKKERKSYRLLKETVRFLKHAHTH